MDVTRIGEKNMSSDWNDSVHELKYMRRGVGVCDSTQVTNPLSWPLSITSNLIVAIIYHFRSGKENTSRCIVTLWGI
jgi:hypothetical protein